MSKKIKLVICIDNGVVSMGIKPDYKTNDDLKKLTTAQFRDVEIAVNMSEKIRQLLTGETK